MKHLLILAISCTSLASLIAAAPARSQTSKSSCPPPYYWVDVNKLSPLARKSLRPVNGKVKMLNPPCVEYEQLMKNIKDIRNMPPASADEYDIITCEFKTQRCTRKPYPLPLPPGTLPRRIPLNADPLNPQSKRYSPSTPTKSLTSRATRRVN